MVLLKIAKTEKFRVMLWQMLSSHKTDPRSRTGIKELYDLSFDVEDYYSQEGCCLTCPSERKKKHLQNDEKCLCYECKCRKCDWYEYMIYGWDEKYNGWASGEIKKCKYFEYEH